MNTHIGIFGGSGFTGIELVTLLAKHASVKLTTVTSDRQVGEPVRGAPALKYVSHEEGASAKLDIALLATPAEVSLKLAPKLLARGSRVLDLSGAFRLKDATLYSKFYGFEHTEPALLAEAVYGLPEVHRATARLVANPGCYATAAALALRPLIHANAIDPSNIVITAASGVSGAGRKASEEYSFMEIEGDFRAYKVLSHQHTPEIAQTVGVKDLVFIPHLLPMHRGILSTAVVTVRQGDVAAILRDAYAKEPLVRLLPSADAVRVTHAARTPFCLIGATTNGNKAVIVSAIDNLLKGAASQAVQNLNLMLGLAETEGLSL
ncbi:MAG: N-acetyl-gamma-glutamyl-phosphate reductase [Myxococcaceae bacterium]|nr:N-acetyl-gamma-glutamyl-phosphate reductase [Myxococcaceae bacterium]